MIKIRHFIGFVIGIVLLSGCTSITGNSISQSNYESSNIEEVVLEIEEMTCTSCALGVEYQLKQLDGVIDVDVSYEEGKGYVKYDANKIDKETIAKSSTIYPAKIKK